MLIEYYKKRSAKLKGDVCFYNPNKAGESIILALNKPQEIDDQWGYKLLGEYSDILRIVEKKQPPAAEPKRQTSGQAKKKKK